MILALLALPVALAVGPEATPIPVTRAFAYSRETLPGIPAGPGVEASPGRGVETSYFIYVVLRPGFTLTGASVWLKGTLHAASLREVESPVTIERDPVAPTGRRDTLVPAVSAPVYQVLPGEPRSDAPKDGADERLARDNEVVIVLEAECGHWRVPVQAVQRLPPAPGR